MESAGTGISAGQLNLMTKRCVDAWKVKSILKGQIIANCLLLKTCSGSWKKCQVHQSSQRRSRPVKSISSGQRHKTRMDASLCNCLSRTQHHRWGKATWKQNSASWSWNSGSSAIHRCRRSTQPLSRSFLIWNLWKRYHQTSYRSQMKRYTTCPIIVFTRTTQRPQSCEWFSMGLQNLKMASLWTILWWSDQLCNRISSRF